MTDIVSIDMSPGNAPIGIEKYIDLVKLSHGFFTKSRT